MFSETINSIDSIPVGGNWEIRCVERCQVGVSELVDYTFSSHLGLNRCLILIVRISTQHDIHAFTEELGNTEKIILSKKLHHSRH